MNKSRIAGLVGLLAAASMMLASCAAPTPAVVTQVVVQTSAPVVQTQVVEVTAQPGAEPIPVVSWLQYDAGNIDPASDERVGNDYVRQAIPAFDAAFAGQWVWDQQYTPFDKHKQRLISAVNSGSEVPDFTGVGSGDVNTYYVNGTLQDLTEWAQAQSWYADMDPNALALCTGPDGKLYCIPLAQTPMMVYVWRDAWPNGFPTTPEQMLTEAARLKAEGKFAMTYFGSTAFGGEGAGRAVFSTLASFGGGYDDGQGKLALNTPENIAAVTWLREMVQQGYVPEIAFAGNFQEESAFMDGTTGSFPTGLFGYRYLNPLTSPAGTKFEKKNENDFLDAVASGEALLAPFPAAAGQRPGCGNGAASLAIPTGATNVDGAHDIINWLMTLEQNVLFVLGPGGGLPTLKSVQAAPEFQTPFWTEAAAVIDASDCSLVFPTIENTSGAAQAVVNVVYKLVKTDPTADISAELQIAQDEFNATVK